MRRWILILVAVIVVVAAAIYFTVSQPGTSGRFSASGTIEATEVNVGTQVGGTLVDVAVSEGDRIKRGGLIVKTDDAMLKSQLAQAEAGLEAAQAQAKQAPSGTSLRNELNAYYAAYSAVKQAQAGVDIANTQLGFASVTAPLSGEVLSVPHTAGENLAPGSPVAVLADLDNLKVTVYVPEGELGKIKLGRQAEISVDSTNRKFTGRITHIAEEAEFTPTNIETKDQRVKQVFAVTIEVKNIGGLLKPGMPADISFKI